MALGVEYFRQYEENNTPEQHKTFFRELEVVMVYFLLARPFCLNKEITEFIKKWVQKLRQNQIIVDPSSGDDMDLDQITFQPSAREAIYKCDVYNYPDISKFVLAKINGKIADPYVNVLYPEIDITLSISVLNQQHSPEECPLGVLVTKYTYTLQPNIHFSPTNFTYVSGPTSWHHTVIKKYMHRVGNLVLLSRPSNSSVREKQYDKKYDRYRDSSFAITQHLTKNFPISFSSEDVEKRHTFLVNTFVKSYYDKS
ncbi:hypothetical protein C2G38_1068034 [Gigaspora rosea]|uniref:GmrSD restriction endonucleases C-terminal domain-containing protein n=1 Tax=Gigaspora rosea TaxID=44941 RepID=A0A397TT52_9GLOM|nr:hypothetical protein C2G38_1068034 [Gigaspora rosea]